MSKFTETYKNTLMPGLPLYGLGEIVSYAGFRWEITGFKPDHDEGCWVYNLKKVDGSDETETDIYELGLTKGYSIEKPGSATHTDKWDRCVKHVESNSKGVNAYAVCTAMLGDESFKSMDNASFDDKIKFYMQKLGIANAGPVPNSLLAAQDLEGREKAVTLTHFDEQDFVTEKSNKDLFQFAVWYYDKSGARKCAVFGNFTDAEAYAKIVDSLGYNNVKIMKGQVEQTGKQLEAAAAKAEDGEGNPKTLINNIKAIQIKRQKATLAARAKEPEKSFKTAWAGLKINE